MYKKLKLRNCQPQKDITLLTPNPQLGLMLNFGAFVMSRRFCFFRYMYISTFNELKENIGLRTNQLNSVSLFLNPANTVPTFHKTIQQKITNPTMHTHLLDLSHYQRMKMLHNNFQLILIILDLNS